MSKGNDIIMNKTELLEIKGKVRQLEIYLENQPKTKNIFNDIYEIIERKLTDDTTKMELEDKIYEAMRNADSELNAELYMLYRRLQDERITLAEAKRLFEYYSIDKSRFNNI